MPKSITLTNVCMDEVHVTERLLAIGTDRSVPNLAL
jgi:hypothetical protein